jgi:hypothetical protein
VLSLNVSGFSKSLWCWLIAATATTTRRLKETTTTMMASLGQDGLSNSLAGLPPIKKPSTTINHVLDGAVAVFDGEYWVHVVCNINSLFSVLRIIHLVP